MLPAEDLALCYDKSSSNGLGMFVTPNPWSLEEFPTYNVRCGDAVDVTPPPPPKTNPRVLKISQD
jgi:hypothetical protein